MKNHRKQPSAHNAPVRYDELTGPLAGWTYDNTGVIHSPSGYRTTAKQMECALWLLGC